MKIFLMMIWILCMVSVFTQNPVGQDKSPIEILKEVNKKWMKLAKVS